MSAKRISTTGRKTIQSIIVTGYQKIKHPQKHYVFIMGVTWDNGERFEIYRRYSDFFSFHTTLKTMIQTVAGRGNEDKTIPQFPKRNLVWRSQAARVTEAKLDQFNRYCQDILCLDASISESAHVVGFFTPRGGDRHLPTLQIRRVSEAPEPAREPLKPPQQELEEYRALAEFVAEDISQVSFKAGDKVFVKSKDKSGWWLCKANGKTGWAPPTFLKKYTELNDIEKSTDSSGYIKLSHPSLNKKPATLQTSRETEEYAKPSSNSPIEEDGGNSDAEVMAEEYKAIEDYDADGPGQVSFREGDIIQVMDKLEDGWWFVSVGQEEGWAPCSYMEKLNGQDDEEEFTTADEAEKYHTVEGYEAEEDDELSFPKGAVISVMQKRLDGWWLVRYKDRTGLAPGTYLRKGLPQIKQEHPKSPEEANPQRGSDRRREMDLAYENIQLKLAKTQPPRRQTVRHWAGVKRGKKPDPPQKRHPVVEPRSPRQPQFPPAYTNCQPNLLGPAVSASDKSRTLGAIRELKEEQAAGQHFSSFRSEGGGARKDGSAKRPVAAPRSRVRNQKSVPLGQPPEEHYARPKIKERSKSSETNSSVSPTKLVPQVSVSSYDRVRTANHEQEDSSPPLSPTRPPRSDYEEQSDDDGQLQPLRPRQPLYDVPCLQSSDEDQPPPLGPGHPLRPEADADLPRPPPRPSPSVYKRAKENSKLDSDSKSVSGLSTSSWSHPSKDKGRRMIKKSRSQSQADEKFQAARLNSPQSPPPVSRVRSMGRRSSTEKEPPIIPPRDIADGANGTGGNPFNEEITGQLLKYILSSPDPSLKETLRDLLTNNEAIRTSLQ